MDYLIPLAAFLFVACLCVVLWLMNRSLLRKLQQARKAEHRYRLLWQQLPMSLLNWIPTAAFWA